MLGKSCCPLCAALAEKACKVASGIQREFQKSTKNRIKKNHGGQRMIDFIFYFKNQSDLPSFISSLRGVESDL